MDDTGAPAFHVIDTGGWLRPTVLEIADQNPGWSAAQIAATVDRREPEHAPTAVAAVQAILDER